MDDRWNAVHDAETLPPSFEENNGSKISQRDIFAFGVMFEITVCKSLSFSLFLHFSFTN